MLENNADGTIIVASNGQFDCGLRGDLTDSGWLSVGGIFNNAGFFLIEGGGTMESTEDAGYTMINSGDAIVGGTLQIDRGSALTVDNSGGGTLNNYNSIAVAGALTVSGTLNNAGSIAVCGGTLVAGGDLVVAGTIAITSGGVISLNGHIVTLDAVYIDGGIIDVGSGALIATTDNFSFVPQGGGQDEYSTTPGVVETGDQAIHRCGCPKGATTSTAGGTASTAS